MAAALFPDLIVNGELVPHTVVAAEAQNHEAPTGKPGIVWRKAANAVAIHTLLLQEARARELQPVPVEVASGRYETDEEALVRGLLEEVIEVEAPSETDIRREWERDPARFRSPPIWEASHILCACDPCNEEANMASHARAVDLTSRVLDDPRSFALLAKEHSDCGSKSAGGAIGQLCPGDTVPEFETVLRRLSEGQITSKPILSRHGWHIIRMDAVMQGAVLPFDSVREKISEAMEKASWARSARLFVNELVASAEISGADLRSY